MYRVYTVWCTRVVHMVVPGVWGGGTVVRILVVPRGMGPGVRVSLLYGTGPTVLYPYWPHCTGLTVLYPYWPHCTGPTVLYTLHCTGPHCTVHPALYRSQWRLQCPSGGYTGPSGGYSVPVEVFPVPVEVSRSLEGLAAGGFPGQWIGDRNAVYYVLENKCRFIQE